MKEFMKYGQLYQLDDENRLWACLIKCSNKNTLYWRHNSNEWNIPDVYCSGAPKDLNIDAKFPAYSKLRVGCYKFVMNGSVHISEFIDEFFCRKTMLQWQEKAIPCQQIINYIKPEPGRRGWGTRYFPNVYYYGGDYSIPASEPTIIYQYCSLGQIRAGVVYDDRYDFNDPGSGLGFGFYNVANGRYIGLSCGNLYWSGDYQIFAGEIWAEITNENKLGLQIENNQILAPLIL